MKAECPVCLNMIEVSGNGVVECPHCHTMLEPVYQTTVTITLDVRDFLYPLLPAAVTGYFVYRSTGPAKRLVKERRRMDRRYQEVAVLREVELLPKEVRRPLVFGAGGLAYLSSLAMLWIYKLVQARYG